MTTCRGCGAMFTEGHDETRCELIAQSLADRRDFLEKESAYLDQIEALTAERDAQAEQLNLISPLLAGVTTTLSALCESVISQIGPKFELHQQAKKILATLGKAGAQ